MLVCVTVKERFSRLQSMCRLRRRQNAKKTTLVISAPYNFRKEDTILPGITDNEMSVLREKAAASRVGTASRHRRTFTSSAAPAPSRTSGPMSYHPVNRGDLAGTTTTGAAEREVLVEKEFV